MFAPESTTRTARCVKAWKGSNEDLAGHRARAAPRCGTTPATARREPMVILQSVVSVPGLRAGQVVEFLLQCSDADYQRWWPGTHLHFHTLERRPRDLGNLVHMDEWVGNRRVKLNGVVTEAIPGRKIVWQLKALVRQPVRLELEVDDEPAGARITHTIRAGFGGLGKVFDPLFRLYFSGRFRRAMDEHVRTEFNRLVQVFAGEPRAARAGDSVNAHST
jgi:hypothetical protein